MWLINCSCFVVLVLVIFHRGICLEIENENDDTEDDRHRSEPSGRCQIDRRSLKNGRIKLRSRGRIVKFVCDPGYELAGKRFATCVSGRWNNPIPLCVARGCYRQRPVQNGQITEMYRGAVLLFTCNPGYALKGSEIIFCDGRSWNTTAPECVVAGSEPEMSCDFEDRGLCGWSHDPHNDFDWKRNQFTTPSGHVGTGPSYDHTFGLGRGGFYLYMEASSPRRVNDTTRLFSPVYPPDYSDSCFLFWYHMYGATTGGIRVYLKPERHVFGELSPIWEKWGDQGNTWMQGHIAVPDFQDNFQIVIEGVRGASYVGDSAIDDVKLTKGTCEDVDNSTDTVAHTEAESCRGRCQEPDEEASCGCKDNCVQNGNCCNDFSTVCSSGNDTHALNPDEPLPDDEIGKTSNIATEPITEQTSIITSETGTNSSTSALTVPFTPFIAAANTTISTSPTTFSVLQLSTTTTTVTSLPETTEILSTPTTTVIASTPSTSTVLSTSKVVTRTVPVVQRNATIIMSSTDSTETANSMTENTTLIPIIATKLVTESRTSATSASTTAAVRTSTSAQTTSTKESQTTIAIANDTITTVITTTSTLASTNATVVSAEVSSPSTTPRNVPTTSSSTTSIPTSTKTSITSISSTRRTYNLRPRTQKTTPVTDNVRTGLLSTSTASSDSSTSSQTTATSNVATISTSPLPTTAASKYEYHIFDTTRWHDRTSRTSTTLQSNQPSITAMYSTKTTSRAVIYKQTTPETIPATMSSRYTTEYFLNHASKEASTAHKNGLPTVTVVSISVVAILCAIAGLIYYMRKQKSKRQSKLSDDSEMRFLSENEVMEYSDASVLDKILVK